MKPLLALFVGIVFGLGLSISGMTNPANVIGFLNLAPGWQPALIFVMGSALIVTLIGYRLTKQRTRPWLATDFHTPTNTAIDGRLLGGAMVFGVGWGLSGYCPGPAIVGAWTVEPQALLFLGSYLLGSLVYEGWNAATQARQAVDG